MCSLEEKMSDIEVRCSDMVFELMGDIVECYRIEYPFDEDGFRMKDQVVAELYYSIGVWE